MVEFQIDFTQPPQGEDAVVGHSTGLVASGLEDIDGVVHLTRIVVSDGDVFERHASRIANVDERQRRGVIFRSTADPSLRSW